MNNKSFTIIELLVAIGVFSVVIASAVGIFTTAIKGQRKALVTQEILDQTSYTLEYISRSIRMAKKDITGSCITLGSNYELTRGEKGIKFKDYQNVCQEFFLEEGKLKQSKGGEITDLTSSNLEMTSLNLNLTGASDSDALQPRITIALSIKGKGQKPEEKSEIKLQTTISQRNPDLK